MTTHSSTLQPSTEAALEALHRGYTPVGIQDGAKRPRGSGWQKRVWNTEAEMIEQFQKWNDEGASGIGLLLGEPSDGLIDVDLDHHSAMTMAKFFLPPTEMMSGRPNNRFSHLWYRVEDEIPDMRQYKLPGGEMAVELRSTGVQTVIPPTIWHSKGDEKPEPYCWEKEPFGGDIGPTLVPGRKLAIQVALTGLAAVLYDAWPREGSRHQAYLALAGTLMRLGDGVHPFWDKNIHVLLSALAVATHDEDGPEARISETIPSTRRKLLAGDKVAGLPTLAELLGDDTADAVKRLADEIESIARGKATPADPAESSPSPTDQHEGETAEEDEEDPEYRPRNPLEERISTWDAVDLGPYLTGEIEPQEPEILTREDGECLFYPGRVNMIYGKSESAKSWIALYTCLQEIQKGERVVYLDMEDDPAETIKRLRAMGATDTDLEHPFTYVRPESPISPMQRGFAGKDASTDGGRDAHERFVAMLNQKDPKLIVVDGMTVLYGLHGLDTNEARGTDVITSWLKTLTRGGRTGVIVIDHTGKGSSEGASPIGAHHKIAMIQGTALRADAITRPVPGEVGRVHLVVYKDRPGQVRKNSSTHKEAVAAAVVMDSTKPGITRMRVEAPNRHEIVLPEADNEEELTESLADMNKAADRIMSHFYAENGAILTTSEVEEMTGLSRGAIREAWKLLKSQDRVVQEGERRWAKYQLSEAESENLKRRGGAL